MTATLDCACGCGRPVLGGRSDRRFAEHNCSKRAYRRRNLKQHNLSTKEWAAKVKAHVAEYKLASGCLLCGFRESAAALDLHHVDPATKSGPVASLGGLETVKAEIAKCVVLCANHHRMVTADEINLELP